MEALLTSRPGFSYWIAVGRYWCMIDSQYLSKGTYSDIKQHVTPPPDSQKNFLVVDSKTENAAIEEAFNRFTSERKDIGILLINQHVRHLTKTCLLKLTLALDC